MDANRLGFQGRSDIPEIGLQYFRNRFYMPSVGRFGAWDPIGYAGGLNVFNYAHSDPVNFIDPMGTEEVAVQGSKAYWQVEEEGLLWDSVNEEVYIGPVVGGRIQLLPEFSGESIKVWDAQQLAKKHIYMDKMSYSSQRGSIRDAFMGKGVKRGMNMQELASKNFKKHVVADIKTAAKATVNSFVDTGASLLTAGLYNKPIELIEVTDEERAQYEDSYAVQRFGMEVLSAALTGGLASAGKVGLMGKVAFGANVLDTASNVVGFGRGVYSAATEGLSWGNALQIAGAALGLYGNSRGFSAADDAAKATKASPGPRPGLACFVAGTLVATPVGKTAIEDLRVGDRVWTTDEHTAVKQEQLKIERSEWRHIHLRMPNPDGSHDILDIELLRPISWMAEVGCKKGAEIWFVLEEMGLEGSATVVSVAECPAIKEGPGRVVLATVTHLNGFVLRLHLEGSDEVLEPTDRHRLYSLTHEDWIPAGRLEAGDVLQTQAGAARIQSIETRPEVLRVYNIEVDTDHCYFVGPLEVLSHNVNQCAAPMPPPKPRPDRIKFKRWKRGEAIDKPLPDGTPPSWETVQQRYWKNRYEAAKGSGEFAPRQLAEMRKGNAPMDYNSRTGKWERRELHHVEAQRHGGDNSPLNLRELTPDWHAEVDPFRHVPGVKPTRGIR